MEFRNVTEAFVDRLHAVMRDGSHHQSRAGETRELLHQSITLTHPLERCVIAPKRHADVFACIAETLWVIAGRSDMEFLQNYLPRAPQFSDDGKVWRAGYGPRIRAWSHACDQLFAVVRELREAPESRRAVINLFDPSSDMEPTRDVPCTNWLQFSIRDGVLFLAVTIRSNDLFWGFSGINAFEWSVLHEMVAYWTNTRVGPVTYFVGSLHVYERHFERADQIIHSQPASYPYLKEAVQRFATRLEDLDDQLDAWFIAEEGVRLGCPNANAIEAVKDPLLSDFLTMIISCNTAKENRFDDATAILDTVSDAALSAAGRDVLSWRYGLSPNCESNVARVSESNSLGQYLVSLHRQKTLDYGNSWKKRGEVFSILPNIDRKIDRLILVGDDPAVSPETVLDTSVDLFLYALKYKTWLLDALGEPHASGNWSDGVAGLETLMSSVVDSEGDSPAPPVQEIAALIDHMEAMALDGAKASSRLVLADELVVKSWRLLNEIVLHRRDAARREFTRQRNSYSDTDC